MALQNIDVAKEASVQNTLNKVTEAVTNSTATHTNGTVRTGADWAMQSWMTADGVKNNTNTIINTLNNSTYGLSAIKTAIGNVGGNKIAQGGTSTTVLNQSLSVPLDGYSYFLGKFIAPVTGIYKIVVTFSKTISNNSYWKIYYPDSTEGYQPPTITYLNATVGSRGVYRSNYSIFQFDSSANASQSGASRVIYMYALAGQLCIISWGETASTSINITNCKVTY